MLSYQVPRTCPGQPSPAPRRRSSHGDFSFPKRGQVISRTEPQRCSRPHSPRTPVHAPARRDQAPRDQARPEQARPDQAPRDQARPEQARPDQARPDQAQPKQAPQDQARQTSAPARPARQRSCARQGPRATPRSQALPRHCRDPVGGPANQPRNPANSHLKPASQLPNPGSQPRQSASELPSPANQPRQPASQLPRPASQPRQLASQPPRPASPTRNSAGEPRRPTDRARRPAHGHAIGPVPVAHHLTIRTAPASPGRARSFFSDASPRLHCGFPRPPSACGQIIHSLNRLLPASGLSRA
jgi:hypothetical protein